MIKMSQADDLGATGQTGSHDRSNRSSSDPLPEPTGQTEGLDRSDQPNADWLQQRIDHYPAHTNDMCEAIEDFDDLDKLGQRVYIG